MSINVEDNVVRIRIQIAPEDETKWQQLYAQTQEMRETANKIESAAPEKEEPGKIISEGNLKDFDEDSQKGQLLVAALRKANTGPAGVETGMLSELTMIVPYLGEAMIAAGVAKKMFDWYFSDGAPGDRRFKRDIPHEQEKFLSREEQKARAIGLKGIIVTSANGWSNQRGAAVTNTLSLVRRIANGQPAAGGFAGSIKNVGLDDKSQGWVP